MRGRDFRSNVIFPVGYSCLLHLFIVTAILYSFSFHPRRIELPPSDYLLAMKVLSARAETMDQDDLRILIRKLGLKNAAEVFAIVKGYYPRKEIKPEARILIEELLSTRDDG